MIVIHASFCCWKLIRSWNTPRPTAVLPLTIAHYLLLTNHYSLTTMIIFQILNIFLSIFSFILLGRVILSWVRPDPYGSLAEVTRIIFMLTEPVLEPIRRILPPAGGLDFSPIVAFLLISVLQSFLRM